ncbi:MAG: hypothetical protein LJE85_10910 [Gammaproteobacteria bacterium]|nr:hypothetical protein [Gammaproteobacteria bacterium]
MKDLIRIRTACTANIIALNNNHAHDKTTAIMDPKIMLTSTSDKVSIRGMGFNAW